MQAIDVRNVASTLAPAAGAKPYSDGSIALATSMSDVLDARMRRAECSISRSNATGRGWVPSRLQKFI